MEVKQKKPTNAQLLRRIQKSQLHLDFTKNTVSLYFSDKGLRLTVDDSEGYALIATGYHTHCFQSWTSNGISRPFLYTKRVIEIANENLKDIEVDGGYSFQKMLEVLKAKDDKSDYNIVTYFSWYLYNIFSPLYSIGESEIESFLVYEAYLHNIACQTVLLSEKKEDMTNKQFFDEVIKNMQDFIEGVDERVIFHKMTDEEMTQANISAIQEQEQEQAMEAQMNGAE
jgi:hypothetical protein